MANRYKVTLTRTERDQLTEQTRSGNSTAAKFIHARALLLCDAGKVVATPAIGGDPDGIAFEAAPHRIFSPNNDGTLTILQENSPDDYSVLQTVATQAV